MDKVLSVFTVVKFPNDGKLLSLDKHIELLQQWCTTGNFWVYFMPEFFTLNNI